LKDTAEIVCSGKQLIFQKDFLDELLDFTRKVNGDGYDA